MAFQNTLKCDNIGLDEIQRDLTQALSDSAFSITEDIELLESDLPAADGLLDQGNETLQRLIDLGDNDIITNLGDISRLTGVDSESSQIRDEELILRVIGAVLINGVLFKAGENNNIEVLRRVYQSSDRDLELTEQIYKSRKRNSFLEKVVVQKLAPTTPDQKPSINEIQERLQLPWIIESQVSYLSDNTALVAYKIPIATNRPIRHATSTANIPREEVTSSIFHYSEVLSSTAAINHWINLGYNSEINSILNSIDPITSRNNTDQVASEINSLVSSVVGEIDYVLTRVSDTSEERKNQYSNKINTKINLISNKLKELLSIAFFNINTIEESDTLELLKRRLTEDEIVYLLEKRLDVTSIDFDATSEELAELAELANDFRAGDTSISSNFINNPEFDVKQEAITSILGRFNSLEEAREKLKKFESVNLSEAKEELVTISNYSLPSFVSPSPSRGYPNLASPSTILAQRANNDRSFEINLKIGALDDALESLQDTLDNIVFGPLAAFVGVIRESVVSANNLVNQLRERLKNLIYPLKRKADAFYARYLSLIGQGTLNSSLLKCAVDFDIGLGSSILDDLLAIIDALADEMLNIIDRFRRIISDILENIICMPGRLIDKLLSEADSYLPDFCQAAIPLEIGEELERALADLKGSTQFRSVNYEAVRGDLISYRAVINTASDRLQQFRRSASCQSELVDQAFNRTIIGIRGAIGF